MRDTTPPPLEALLQQVEQAIQTKLYYAALAVLFTIPDVCASLESDPQTAFWATQEKYSKWFDMNVARYFKTISGDDFYHMRGGVVHRGQFSHKKAKFDRVAFILPGSPFSGHDTVFTIMPGSKFSGKPIEEINNTYPGREYSGLVLLMKVVEFCQTITQATREWANRMVDNTNVQTNVLRLVHLRDNGLTPLFVGFPIIA